MINAAIVGLGKIGSRFDEDPKRENVFSHTGAYQKLKDDFNVVAGCDVSEENLKLFSNRCPRAKLFSNFQQMLTEVDIDVLSICTPADLHRQQVLEGLESENPRLIWCEKPLALTEQDGLEMVKACRQRDVPLIVHHNRRWMGTYQKAKQYILAGKLGQLTSFRISTPNRIWTLGSHMIDLLIYYLGMPDQLVAFERKNLLEDDEKAFDVMASCQSGVVAHILTTGTKKDIIVEVDIVGDKGRVWVEDNGNKFSYIPFGVSEKYQNYNELNHSQKEVSLNPPEESTLVKTAEEIVAYFKNQRASFSCEGEDGLQVIQIINQLHKQGSNG
jgi:predicted dehydrogenase